MSYQNRDCRAVSTAHIPTMHSSGLLSVFRQPLPTPHSPLATPHFPLPTSHFPLPTSHSPLPTPHLPHSPPRLHPGRGAGGDRHHRHADGLAHPGRQCSLEERANQTTIKMDMTQLSQALENFEKLDRRRILSSRRQRSTGPYLILPRRVAAGKLGGHGDEYKRRSAASALSDNHSGHGPLLFVAGQPGQYQSQRHNSTPLSRL